MPFVSPAKQGGLNSMVVAQPNTSGRSAPKMPEAQSLCAFPCARSAPFTQSHAQGLISWISMFLNSTG